jgi:hypothetical protein
MLLCAVVCFKLVTQPRRGRCGKKNNVTTHRVTSQTFTVLSFFVFELGNRQGAITIGSCRASTHSGGCLFLSFFYFVINIFGGLLSLSGNHLHGNPSPSAGICETKKKCATEYYYHPAIHFQKAD